MKSACDLDSACRSAITFHADSSDFSIFVKVLLTPSISSLSSCLKIEISDFSPPKCSSILLSKQDSFSMILSSKGRSSGVLSILQDSVFPSDVAPRSLFRFGDDRNCVEDELEDLWFRLDIGQLFYAPNNIFKTLHSSQTNKNYGAEKTPPSAILLVPIPKQTQTYDLPHHSPVDKQVSHLCAVTWLEAAQRNSQRNNKIRGLEAEILQAVCTAVEMEPVFQEVTGEVLQRSANKARDARLDIAARGFWAREKSAFFDVRVCHPNADSYKNLTTEQIYKLHENDKKAFTRLEFFG